MPKIEIPDEGLELGDENGFNAISDKMHRITRPKSRKMKSKYSLRHNYGKQILDKNFFFGHEGDFKMIFVFEGLVEVLSEASKEALAADLRLLQKNKIKRSDAVYISAR